MEKTYTIKDIAQLTKVLKGTVDRVLHKREKVSQVALDKVKTVLNEIEYHPNLMARNLKKTKIYHISILFPNTKKLDTALKFKFNFLQIK